MNSTMDSDDLPLENDTNSKTNLIDVQHVGVTAKIRTPMKRLLPECSSAETDSMSDIFKNTSKSKYNKLTSEQIESSVPITPPLSTTSTTETSKPLYEMQTKPHRTHCGGFRSARMRDRNMFSRIEFQLYKKSSKKRLRHCRCQRAKAAKKRAAAFRQKQETKKTTFFERLRSSVKEMYNPKVSNVKSSYKETTSQSSLQPSMIFPQSSGVYFFEHGCAEYLHVTDSPPLVLSNSVAERTTYHATLFWTKFFGSLYIGVTFVVTFLLQAYRFLLYSFINTLLVGMLQMTSDYLFKPMLTVTFNGFLQPPLTFLYNIFNSLRDLLEPVAETLNNFMKPLATVARSFRLVEANYKKKKFIKNV